MSGTANPITITNGRGVFSLVVPPGDVVVMFYYGTCTVGKVVHVEAGYTPPITQSVRYDCPDGTK